MYSKKISLSLRQPTLTWLMAIALLQKLLCIVNIHVNHVLVSLALRDQSTSHILNRLEGDPMVSGKIIFLQHIICRKKREFTISLDCSFIILKPLIFLSSKEWNLVHNQVKLFYQTCLALSCSVINKRGLSCKLP